MVSMFSKLGIERGREPVLVDYVRTPLGKKKNGLIRRMRGDDLSTHCIEVIVERQTALDPKLIDDCIVGCNSQIGTCALDIGRTSVLAAGIPWTIPGVSINRQCASGMQACIFAWQEIATGDKDCVLAGGAEVQNVYPIMADMTVIGPDGKPQIIPPNKKISQNKYLRESMEKYKGAMGGQINSAEIMGKVWNKKIGNTYEEFREELDKLSLLSHEKALKPSSIEARNKEISPIRVPKLDENGKPILDVNKNIIPDDENSVLAVTDTSPRAGSTLEKMASLKGIVRKRKGYLTAGNSCPTTDGGVMSLWTSRKFAEEHGLKIRSTLESFYTVGTDPVLMLTGPIAATPPALERIGLTLDDMDFIEINEAFSTVVKASCNDLGLDWADPRLNQYGGAIAIGHPTGVTGCRLLGSMTHMMEDTNKTYGLGTLCVGLGMGIAGVIKREGA